MRKLLIYSILIFGCLMIGFPSAKAACSYQLNWNLVGSDKKIHYIDNSKYKMIESAQYQWTKYGKVKIEKDTWLTQNDLTVSDYYEVSGTLGYTSYSGVMQFNTYHFDSMTYYERFKTVMHELGHALGLDHFGPSPYVIPPVMSQGKFEAKNITDPDKNVYLCIWG